MNNVIQKAGEEAADESRSMLNLFACKCPRCRKGDMFVNNNPWKLRSTMKMHKQCVNCGQAFNIEVGFYYGSSYVSYALSIMVCVFTFVAWWSTIGFSLDNQRFFFWMAANAVILILLQPYLMRLARTGWLAFFVRYDKYWRLNPPKPLERVNDEQEGNW